MQDPVFAAGYRKAKAEYEEEVRVFRMTQVEEREPSGRVEMKDTPLTIHAVKVRDKQGFPAAYAMIEAHFTRRTVQVSTRKYRARRGRK